MSRRDITPAMQAAFAQAHVTAFVLLELGFDTGTQYLAALPFDVVVDGITYQAAQGIGSIEPITETAGYAAGLAFTLSLLTEAAIASAITSDYQGRPVTIKLAVVDGTTLRIDPVAWRGSLDVPTLTDGARSAQVRVTAESEFIRWQQPTGQLFSDADHQAAHAGDLYFQFAAAASQDTVVWPGKEFFKR